MKIIYIGIVDFSHHGLAQTLKCKGDIVGIVTSKNRDHNDDFCDLTPLAKQYNIPIHYCLNINDKKTIEWIKNHDPDIIFCWGWSQIIGKDLLSVPKMGIVGSHPTLLPENRGRHPLIWSKALGLKKGGLTFFFMDEGADSGPILSQESFNIDHQDTANDLYEKVKVIAIEQIEEFLPKLISNNYRVVEQKSENSSYWRKRTIEDGVIDFRMSQKAIINLVRALSKPYPGAQIIFKNQNITIWEITEYNNEVTKNIEPGRVISISNNKPAIKCYDGAVLLEKYEPNAHFNIGDYVQ